MRLSSNFHDYYDGAIASYQSEPLPHYNRIHEVVTIGKLNSLYRKRTYIYKSEIFIRNIVQYSTYDYILKIIGFCGKLYPIYTYGYKHRSIDTIPCDSVIINKIKIPSVIYPLFDLKLWKFWQDDHTRWFHKFDNIKNIITNTELLNLFYRYKTPIFIYQPYRDEDSQSLLLNPRLSDYEFQRIIDPYTVCQELNMFLNNDLVEEKKPIIPTGTNKNLIECKGFDYKWSFRKKSKEKK